MKNLTALILLLANIFSIDGFAQNQAETSAARARWAAENVRRCAAHANALYIKVLIRIETMKYGLGDPLRPTHLDFIMSSWVCRDMRDLKDVIESLHLDTKGHLSESEQDAMRTIVQSLLQIHAYCGFTRAAKYGVSNLVDEVFGGSIPEFSTPRTLSEMGSILVKLDFPLSHIEAWESNKCLEIQIYN